MTTSSAAHIHRTITELAEDGRDVAVATVLQAEGSTPQEAGKKAVLERDGSIHGTIGGGAVEAETQRRAAEAIRSGEPIVLDYELEGAAADADEPICGGSMRLLIDPTAARHREAYRRAAEAERNRRSGALVTCVRGAEVPEVTVRWIPEDGEGAEGEWSDAVRSALAQQEPVRLVNRDEAGETAREVLVQPLVLPPMLLIAGGGHVGQALAAQADLVGFAVTVIDDRREFTDPSLYPAEATTLCGDIAGELADFPFDEDVYVAIATRGHQHDRSALAACLGRDCAYVGMIGSTRKVKMIRRDLLESGEANEQELDRVYAPIGLDIGAETVPEIAASIVAQLIAVRRTGSAPRIPLD